MTGEELDRAIEFLLKSDAQLEARIEQVNASLSAQLAETRTLFEETRKLFNEHAETQTQLIQVMTRTFDAQAKIDESLRATLNEFTTSTKEALARLAESQAHTDRRLDALIDIVREGRNGRTQGG